MSVFLAIVWPAHAAGEGASAWQDGPRADVRLIAASDTVGMLDRLPLGLEVRLDEHWKTYWRSPGDAGFPVQLDWSDSRNLADTAFAWPAPTRFRYFDLETVGYRDHVVFPVDAVPARPGEPVALRARVDMLVCDDVCIPHSFDLALDLPAGPASPTAHANMIERFRSRVPGDGTGVGLSFAGAAAEGPESAPVIRAAFRSETPFGAPDLLVEGGEDVVYSRPAVELRDGGRLAVASLTARDALGGPVDLSATPLTLTLVDGARSMEAPGVVPTAGGLDVGAGGGVDLGALLSVVGLALLGGLILNLMPCVLPVLSIKLLSVVGHGGGDRQHVRRGFLATTAGILASFLVLAGAAIAVKAAGLAVGWGIQFQQPLFVITLVAVLTLFAANLWGLFEIRLPGAVSDAAVAASGGRSLAGHFFQGAFATVLATPCTAPFLGTSVGFALARGPVEILAIFAALGLGMALPFLLVAAFPALATRLPRPGPWMVWLRRALALALLATALWLLSILAAQLSPAIAALIGAAMAVVLALLALRLRLPAAARHAVPAALVAVLALAFLVPSVVPLPAPGSTPAHDASAGGWQPFDRARIPGLVAEGRVVFVDVTADWCITCQVNKARVLESGATAAALADERVVRMRADWTNPDPEISRYLADFGRFGIPFNVVYGPGAPQGTVLPELLSAEAVHAGLARASGPVALGLAGRER